MTDASWRSVASAATDATRTLYTSSICKVEPLANRAMVCAVDSRRTTFFETGLGPVRPPVRLRPPRSARGQRVPAFVASLTPGGVGARAASARSARILPPASDENKLVVINDGRPPSAQLRWASTNSSGAKIPPVGAAAGSSSATASVSTSCAPPPNSAPASTATSCAAPRFSAPASTAASLAAPRFDLQTASTRAVLVHAADDERPDSPVYEYITTEPLLDEVEDAAEDAPPSAAAGPSASPSAAEGALTPPQLQLRRSSFEIGRLGVTDSAALQLELESAGFAADAVEAALDVDHIVSVLRGLPWFSKLDVKQLRELSGRATLKWCSRYHTIYREAQPGQYLHVLLHGQARSTSTVREEENDRLIHAGQAFGEYALLTAVRRGATVTATAPCVLLLLSAVDCRDLDLDLDAGGLRTLVHARLLERIPFYRDALSDAQRHKLAQVVSYQSRPADSVLFSEGGAASAFYILLEGRVAFTDYKGKSVGPDLHASSEKPWFGEHALWQVAHGKVRTRTATCAEDCTLLVTRRSLATRFLGIAPTFCTNLFPNMYAWRALDALRHCGVVVKPEDSWLDIAKEKADEEDPVAVHRAEVELRWRAFTSSALAKARLEQELENDRKSVEELLLEQAAMIQRRDDGDDEED